MIFITIILTIFVVFVVHKPDSHISSAKKTARTSHVKRWVGISA